ncbi:MAG TPA: hypothetical protein VGM77_02655 [Gemmatimonadales bacterium]|jgi:hypothetical protein
MPSTRALIATATVLLAGAAQAQQPRDFTPYLIADRAAEIALARSAAPAAVSDAATVLVLTPKGFVEAKHGTNGFTCFVLRSFAANIGDPNFWNPKVRAPHCLTPPAVRTVLPEMQKRAEWILAGVSTDEIKARTSKGYASHQFPTPAVGAMAYMTSPEQYLQDDTPHNWTPHLMFYYDRTLPPSTWGAVDGSTMVIDGTGGDPASPVTLLVPVRRWSDGTPATPPAGH